jgi:outer membrane protein assembly factor BamE (lipoprotein component of BamABCDE complex)
MFFDIKNHLKFFLLSVLIILVNCQLKEPLKTHGINFLENRAEKLTVNTSNKNDIISVMGKPHITEAGNNDTWIYLERVLTKGSYHKFGKIVLKENNVLILDFDKYGVLKNKKILKKDEINKIEFSKKITENDLSQKSFVEKFLKSVQQKMYGSKK